MNVKPYTVKDLQELLDLKERAVLKMLQNGEIVSYRLPNGTWRVLREEYDAYVQRNTHNPKGY